MINCFASERAVASQEVYQSIEELQGEFLLIFLLIFGDLPKVSSSNHQKGEIQIKTLVNFCFVVGTITMVDGKQE